MPSLDLSEAFDPEIIDTFDVIRRKQVTNDFGEADNGSTVFSAVTGVVDAGDDNKIAIHTDEQHFGKTISVVTKFRLRGVSKVGSAEYAPDLILWNGDYFKVIVVEDYSRYGLGWIQAQCTSEDFVDQAPPIGVRSSVIDNG
jgi:hypothetical protein